MSVIRLEVDFALFPDNTVLGSTFTLNGFQFTDKGVPPSFVNESGSLKGLQFGNMGVRVKLPVETVKVTVRAAAFAGDFGIIGINGSGTPVVSTIIPGDNSPHVVDVIHPRLAALDFVGGGNEGLIDTIEIRLECSDEHAAAEAGTIDGTAGIVRDIDFSQAQTQVLIGNGVYHVVDEDIQRVLELSLTAQRPVRVTTTDSQIDSVTLEQTLGPACEDDGCVTELSCAGFCTAVIQGHGAVTTDDSRALGVLLASVARRIPVQNLRYDNARRILQVKVNVSPS